MLVEFIGTNSQSPRKRLGIVEDDPGCQFVYTDVLREEYDIDFFESFDQIQSLSKDQLLQYALFVFDLLLRDGCLVQKINKTKEKEWFSLLPFIVVSAMDDLETMEICSKVGAVDYLTKPFNRNELKFRIHRALNNDEISGSVHIGGFSFDPHRRLVFCKDLKTDILTQKEYHILYLLMKAGNQPQTWQTLYASIWGNLKVSPKTLDVHICNLRKKIAPIFLDIVGSDGRFLLKKIVPEERSK